MAQRERRAEVEKAVRRRGWSERIVEELIQKTGASRRTLYRDRDEIAKQLADEEAASIPERRALFLQDLRRVRDDAAARGDYSPAARLLGMEATILGVDEAPLPDLTEPEGELDTSLEGVLREVRRLRKQAQAGHKHTAAEKLLAREVAIVESIRQRDEEIERRNRGHLTEEQLVELVIEAAAKLPEALRARLREALG